jgi:hypothetical protein
VGLSNSTKKLGLYRVLKKSVLLKGTASEPALRGCDFLVYPLGYFCKFPLGWGL